VVRKPVFSRDEIVDAALQVVAREGLALLSARKVAEELGSSTAPVYSNFENMERLEEVVKRAAVDRLLACTQKRSSSNRFLDIGLGFIEFAMDWPRLYSALFLEQTGTYDPGLELMETILAAMAEMPELKPLQRIERAIMLKKMAVFTHGLATEICNGQGSDLSDAEIRILLDEVGQAVLKDAFLRPPRTEDEIALLGSFYHERSQSDS